MAPRDLGNFASQGFELLLHGFCVDSSSPLNLSDTWSFYMGKWQSPQISAILRKTSTRIAQTNIKILARETPCRVLYRLSDIMLYYFILGYFIIYSYISSYITIGYISLHTGARCRRTRAPSAWAAGPAGTACAGCRSPAPVGCTSLSKYTNTIEIGKSCSDVPV